MIKSIVIILKGCVLGFSIMMPGISGGTMAFVMGIYEKLIGEISKFKTKHIKSLLSCLSFKKQKIKKSVALFRKTWEWSFLTPLIFGIVLAGVVFIAFASPFIKKYSLEFYSIIFGLVLASVFKPFQKVRKTTKIIVLFFLSFAGNTFLFISGSDLLLFSGALTPLVFIPVGFLVAMALIVPGISGSYLLLIFGLYEKTLQALRQGDILVMFCFLTGALLGVFLTARLIRYLIKNYFNETMALILGLILASLYAIYPLPKESWQDIFSFDIEKETFLLCSMLSFLIFMLFNLFYEIRKKLAKL